MDRARLALLGVVGLGCLLVAGGRFLVPGHGLSWPGTYEAFAHLWIGGLLGAYAVNRERLLLGAVGVLTLLEIVLFLLK